MLVSFSHLFLILQFVWANKFQFAQKNGKLNDDYFQVIYFSVQPFKVEDKR